MQDEYQTLASENQFEIKVKGSRFIATGREVESKEQAETYLKKLSKKFYDATHNCFAYIIGFGAEQEIIFRYSDDGEPSGTAGQPIYNIIKGDNITNAIIVVTRYYGGTKLGTGGLIRAYGDAAKELLANTPKSLRIIKKEIGIEYDYDLTSQIMHQIQVYNADIIDNEYDNKARTFVKIRANDLERFERDMILKSHGQAKILKK